MSELLQTDGFLFFRSIVTRTRKIREKAPRKFVGGVFINVLGYQARTLYRNLLWQFRIPKAVSSYLQPCAYELDKYGTAAIPNFLFPEEFASLREEFTRLLPQFTVAEPRQIVFMGFRFLESLKNNLKG